MSLDKNIKGKLFIDELNITNVISGTSVNNLDIDSSGNVVIGSAGGSGSTSDSYWLSGGTVITLEFSDVTNAVTLSNSGFISLSCATNYTPSVGKINTLITRGDGTWNELSRT